MFGCLPAFHLINMAVYPSCRGVGAKRRGLAEYSTQPPIPNSPTHSKAILATAASKPYQQPRNGLQAWPSPKGQPGAQLNELVDLKQTFETAEPWASIEAGEVQSHLPAPAQLPPLCRLHRAGVRKCAQPKPISGAIRVGLGVAVLGEIDVLTGKSAAQQDQNANGFQLKRPATRCSRSWSHRVCSRDAPRLR